jgi:hypothetical protein
MDWVMIIVIASLSGLVALFAVMAFAGWVANNFFGKSEAWLDYGLDEDEM